MFEHNPPVHARPFSVDEHAGDRPEWYPAQSGITLREQAALTAFSAILTGLHTHPGRGNRMTHDEIARAAFRHADAFLDEFTRPARERRQEERRQERARVQQSLYFVADHWSAAEGAPRAGSWRFVYDKEDERIIAAQYAPHGGEWIAATADDIAAMTHDLLVENAGALDDPAAYCADVSDELPEWAAPGADHEAD